VAPDHEHLVLHPTNVGAAMTLLTRCGGPSGSLAQQ